MAATEKGLHHRDSTININVWPEEIISLFFEFVFF